MSEAGHHQSFWNTYIISTDHKMIGKQFIFSGMLWAIVGGMTAMMMRWQIANPGIESPVFGMIGPQQFNQLVTMHGTIMVFFVAMPLLVAGFSNFVIPLQLGARDMAFPRLNMFSYWAFVVASIIMAASFFVPGGPASGGWTAYPPLSASAEYSGTQAGIICWIMALTFAFASTTMGGVNYLVTLVTMRTKGMTYTRVPLATWFLIFATIAFFLAVGPVIAGAIMMLLDIGWGAGFFLPQKGGEPLLWQHLFWFFGHPEVYVVFLPGMGLAFEVLPTFSRRPVFGYKKILWCLVATTVLAYVVWAHHMFISGMNPKLAMPFSVLTIAISVPLGMIYMMMYATLRKGSITLTAPMLWALGFIATFLVGGLTGLFLGAAVADIYFHDTYFVVAHFHYTFFPATFFGGFTGLTYYFPKMYGRHLNETLSKLHFWLTFIFFNAVFWPLFRVGAGGMPRRIADPSTYSSFMDQFNDVNTFVTYAAFCLMASQLIFVANFIYSIFKGEKAVANPWRAATLDWCATPIKPGHGNFGPELPVVTCGPYEYSQPGADDDFIPQARVDIKEGAH